MAKMRLSTLLRRPAEWIVGRGPEGDVAVSSRVRLARNLSDHAFPGWAKVEERERALRFLEPLVEGLPVMRDAFSHSFDELDKESRQILVERHLISREHAARGRGSAVVINREQSVSVMINEEDHLRLQGISSGYDLTQAYQAVCEVDEALETQLPLAVDAKFGYLTACPTNTGTGMRASVMLHLPALSMMDQISQIMQSANSLGLAVRGLYGEGSEAMGNLFQVSNQLTLGVSEEEILGRLQRVVTRIIEVERQARANLLRQEQLRLLNSVGRAYGLLCFAWQISSLEALNSLSLLRLGAELGLIEADFLEKSDLLMLEIQPAHLQRSAQKALDAGERDELRAILLREQLASLPPPQLPLEQVDG